MKSVSSDVRVGVSQWLLLFVCGIVAAGAYVLGHAFIALGLLPITGYVVLLAVLTVVAGRFAIHVPGYPATVSVSELFVFASILLFGPAFATLTVALDGLSSSLAQRNRRLHRTLFNIAEPAISVWVAGQVFFALSPTGPLAREGVSMPELLLPTAAMAATYFLLNSGLTAVALALESGHSVFAVWRRHALYLALNYFAGASLASFASANKDSLGVAMIAIGLPILALSYAAYKSASGRLLAAEEHARHTAHLYLSTVEMLAIAVDAKDRVTHGHIRRVQRHTVAVAKALGIAGEIDLKAIEAASLLHDLGKIAIPDSVLNKPGTLNAIEYEHIKTHANIGAIILEAVDFPYPIAPIVKHHHENWDGTGYPDKLAGTDIPIGARIIAVVDCFDAVTSERPYRRPMVEAEALAMLQNRRGRMYDPAVVDMFVRMLPELRLADHDAHVRERAYPTISSFEYRVPAPSPAPTDETMGILALLRANGPDVTDRIRHVRPGAETCLFAVAAEANRLIVAYATQGISRVAASELPFGQGLSGWVAVNRQTIVNSDPGLDFGDAALELGLRNCLCIPIFAFGTVAAVLSVYDSNADAFSSHDVRVLGSLAQEHALTASAGERAEWPGIGHRRTNSGAAA